MRSIIARGPNFRLGKQQMCTVGSDRVRKLHPTKQAEYNKGYARLKRMLKRTAMPLVGKERDVFYKEAIARCTQEKIGFMKDVMDQVRQVYSSNMKGERVTTTSYCDVVLFALYTLRLLRNSNVPVPVYNSVLRACSSNIGLASVAPQVYEEMEKAGAKSDFSTFRLLLRAKGKLGSPEEVNKILSWSVPNQLVK